MAATYTYNKLFAWDRYWEGTVARSNDKMASTTEYLIELLGPEKIANLTKDDIKSNLSNLGYNLFFEIRKDNSLITGSYASYSSTTLSRFSLPCSTFKEQTCSVTLREDKGAPARNLEAKFLGWLTNGIKDPYNPKYDNFTNFFLFFFISIFSTMMAIKKSAELRIREKEEENRQLIQKLDEAARRAKRELDEYSDIAEEEKNGLLTEIRELQERQAQGPDAEESHKIKEEYEKLVKKLHESRTSKEIKKVFSGIFENLVFSDRFINNVEIKTDDSSTRKLCMYLSSLNDGKPNPLPQARKQWHGNIVRISDKDNIPVQEYNIGKIERLFVQFPGGDNYFEIINGKRGVTESKKPYIANVDYHHKLSDGR